MTDMYDYLHNRKPDWFPDKVGALLGARGQITRKAVQDLSYWEFALIGFNDIEEQKAWMSAFAAGLEKHHVFMEKLHAKSESEFIDSIIDRLESRQSLISR